ncbi:(2Fe-2S)-binding protein [Nocardia takedensis]
MSVVPGDLLTRPEWLSARITEMGVSWGTTTPRIAGTLWWCMVASALVEHLAAAYVAGERPPCPSLDALRCEVRPDGGVERVHLPAADPENPDPARTLHDTLTAVIDPVAAVSGAGVAALWAIVADAIGNRALDAGDAEAGLRLAGDVGGRLPTPRFVEVGGRNFVRRVSCCLVFEVPGCQMCTSCPKRPAAERAAMLADSVARG